MSNVQYEAIPIDPALFEERYTTSSSPHRIYSSSSAPIQDPSSSTDPESLSTQVPAASGTPFTPEQARLLLIRVQSLEVGFRKQQETLENAVSKRGYDADDEDGDENRPKKRPANKNKNKNRSKPNQSETRLITHKERRLTDEEKRVRKDLLAHLEKNMKKLAGLQEDKEILPSDVEPGEYNGTIIPDFKKDVRYTSNKRLIAQATYIVHRDQTNVDTRSLTYTNVKFTAKDVEELAKDAFRTWKRHHEAEVDPEARRKKQETKKKGMRHQRRREKKKDRMKAAGVYSLLHSDVDVTPLLLTDWMSEYLSDRSELVDDDERDAYLNNKLVAAGYSLHKKDEEVWEIIKPGFRSAELNDVYAELDKIFAQEKRGDKKKKRAVPRVDLGARNNDIPCLSPYPFMVDRTWKILHVEAKNRIDEFEVESEDPEGFGTNKRQTLEDSV